MFFFKPSPVLNEVLIPLRKSGTNEEDKHVLISYHIIVSIIMWLTACCCTNSCTLYASRTTKWKTIGRECMYVMEE